MFKSSFAQEILEETKHHNSSHLQDAILPIQRHNLYKSQFAASTHGPLDNVDVNIEDEPPDRPPSKFGHRPASDLDNINIPGNNNETVEFQTSDLGTSDFSSSEIWPSTSSSPFEYTQRYRRCSFGDSVSGQVATQNSFLNLQSSMQFSYLKRACMELDLGLDEDDWNSIAANLLKDFNKNIRNIAINNIENFVNLGDFLSELQSYREEKRRTKLKDDNSNFSREDSISEEDLNEHLSSKALTAKLAAKELETLQVRLECQQLYNDNIQLREEFKQLKQISNPKKYLDLQKEIEHLHWQLNKMENSRKLYELATGQLVTFLEQVSSSLSTSTSSRGSQNTLAEIGGLSSENILQAKRLSLASLDMARSQSMPGLVLADTLLNLPKNRRISAREKRVRRSSSVSKTRVSSTSPLPSLAEQEDPKGSPGEAHASVPSAPNATSHIRSPNSDCQSTDSFPHYRRSNSVSDPLCVSTPKSYKSRLKTKDIESDSEVSKRGTLTSLSSSSSASPPSTDTSRSRDNCSSESLASVGMVKTVGHSRSMSSLLSEPKVLSLTAPQLDLVSGEQKVVLASKASRLLKTVKLMLAREKSYNVSSAEGRKRGRKQSKSAFQHRCSGSPCSCCPEPPLAPGAVLRTASFDTLTQFSDTQEIHTKVPDKIEASKKETNQAPTATGDKNKKYYLAKPDRLFASKEVTNQAVANHTSYNKTKKTKNLSRQDSRGSSISINYEQGDEDNCVMCLKEKEMEGKQSVKTRAASIEQRIHNLEPGADNKVHRSKSDAQEKMLNEKEIVDSVKSKSSTSSKFIKRSRSFSRIFSYSMLNRSKEYRL
eukprot:TRINITY_DN22614_c0_g1_i2.p1 TRINITY_DN22614_c0_g1~~TRINITY_DN22614_c0_g1_i2.p1  ORF type:complete len:826 (+),score=189.98 TRINITY_DN22614_c0_g1_i2:94-2571(+)